MDLYEYILENESERYYFYYSWEEKPDKVASMFIKGLQRNGKTISLVDVFPEPNVRNLTLGEPLEIQTKCGKTMWLPVDFKVKIHSAFRFLYEYV